MMEFGAKLFLKDNMFSVMKKNAEMQREFKERIDQTNMAVKGLGKAKATPTISVNDKATGIAESILNTVETVGAMTATPEMGVKDNATKKVDVILEKIREAKSMVVSPVIRLRDNVTSSVGKIKRRLKEIATTYTPIVRVRDLATKGLSKIKNTLGGLKKVFSPIVKIKDGATKVIKSIHSGLQGLGKMAVKPLVAIKDGATAGLGKIKNILGSLAKGVTVAVTLAGAGATALLGGSIKEGASLEQSIGGVETLFKGDAGKVKANADMAFQTAGLSANAYMETVTSFSASLLQSLGGDTAKASTIADQAIIDMADNANKFGTDMGSIQNAYQGFAKQNYTMLDNLKLGYGGTKEEMERLLSDAQKLTGTSYNIDNLADVYTAIGVIQDQLNITGTTAKEAEQTFSGSFASMKASAQNLMGNLSVGDGEAVARSMGELITTASTFFFGNFVPMLQNIFSNLPSAVSTAVSNVAPMIKEKVLPLITSIKDTIFTGLSSIGIDTGLLQNVLDQLFNVNVDGGGLAGMFSSLKGMFVNTVNTILQILPPLISAVQEIAPVMLDIFSTVINAVGQIVPYVTPVIETIKNIIVTAMPVIQQVITTVANAIVAIMPTVSSIFEFVGNVIQQVLTVIGNHMGLFQTIVSTVVTVVSTVWQALAPVISAVVDVIITVVDGLLTGIEAVFDFLAPYIQTIWESICGFFDAASSTISTIIDTLKSIFEGLFDAVSTVFGNIQDTVSSVIDTVTGVISGAIDAISGFIDKIGGAISAAKDFIGSGVDKVKGFFGFAYGKDRVPYDNYPAVLHQGEKVLTRNQADQYERSVSTRGVQLTKNVQPLERSDGSTTPTGDTRITQDTPQESKGGTQVNIEKLADTVVIEKEADVDKVVEDMVKKFRKLVPNMP